MNENTEQTSLRDSGDIYDLEERFFEFISSLKGINKLINYDYTDRKRDDVLPTFFDSKERMRNKIYLMVGYPSKIYYEHIIEYLKSYTNENDLVLDTMCGSGSTGVACILTNRKFVLSDGSPTASFFSKNYIAPINPIKIREEYTKLLENIEPTLNKLYSIKCDCEKQEIKCENTGIISYIMSSDIHICDHCNSEIILYEAEKVGLALYECGNCGSVLDIKGDKRKLSLFEKRRPVLVSYKCKQCTCGKIRHRRKIVEEDIKYLQEILFSFNSYWDDIWFPETSIIYNRAYPRPGGWPGIGPDGKIPDLFSKRNLLALSILHRYTENIDDENAKQFFMFTFIGSLLRSSLRVLTTSVFKEHYRVPPFGKEANALEVFKRKYKKIYEVKKDMMEKVNYKNSINNMRIFTNSAEKIFLPDNSVDYVFIDPPYGGYIPFYELNLFYSSWLRKEEDFDNEIIIPMDYEKKDGYVEKWGNLMFPAMKEIKRVLKPDRYITLAFHSNFSSMWEELRKLMVNKLSFDFINMVPVSRGTTFHMNRGDDTIPNTAFITYKKTSVNNHLSQDYKLTEIIDTILKNQKSGITIRKLQGEIIKIYHDSNTSDIPSLEEIRNILRKGHHINTDLWYQNSQSN